MSKGRTLDEQVASLEELLEVAVQSEVAFAETSHAATISGNQSTMQSMTRNSGQSIEGAPQMLAYLNTGTMEAMMDFADRPGLATLMYKKAPRTKERNERAEHIEEKQRKADDREVQQKEHRTFGMLDGVFARCLLNIFGVIMFLRLGYVVGTSGMWLACAIILISSVITLSTALSLSAITTNGEVMGGGAYLMISRALGPEYGGAIGVMFAVANAVSVAMYVVGFAEAVSQQIHSSGVYLIGTGEWDIPVIGMITLVSVLVICIVGMKLVVRIQLLLLVVLLACIVTIFIGSPVDQPASGVHSFSMEQLSLNSGPDWTVTGKDGIGGFFFVLSIFFPAVTGIMAGANISGELKDPHRDIPVGTISAVLITTVVYLGMVVVYAGAATRIALTTDMLVAVKISAWGPAVYAGIYAATISSAIASFVGAPRVLQAVAIDNLFPFLVIFKKEGCGREPINGYIVTGLIATVFILIGDLNAIAPLISGFFMITYAFINFACFSASYARSPGWRPSFRFYNKWVALVTAALCIIILFLLNWVSGIITLGIGFGLKKYLEYKDVNPSWGTGSALHAIQYNKALTAIVNMNQTHHIKNYRPQLLVLSGPLEGRQGLQIFSQMLSKSKGIFIYGNVLLTETVSDIRSPDYQKVRQEQVQLRERRLLDAPIPIKNGFVEHVIATSLRHGCGILLQQAGISGMRPNVVMMGYQHWQDKLVEEVDEYVGTIRDAFFFNYGVTIVRNWERLEAPDWEVATRPVITGTIDVWWLWDDGGLTLLLPHLLRLHKHWAKCKIRVMAVNMSKNVGDEMHMASEMNKLITRFRIPATVESDLSLRFDKYGELEDVGPDMLDYYSGTRHPSEPSPDVKATAEEQNEQLSRSAKRQLKIAELVRAKSAEAQAIFITIPVPELRLDSLEFVRWLDCLSSVQVPVCLVRGNQDAVMTFDL